MSKLKPLKCNLAALFCPFLLLSSFVWELHQIDFIVLRTIHRIYLPSVELMMFYRTDQRFWPALLRTAPASAFGSCVKTLPAAGDGRKGERLEARIAASRITSAHTPSPIPDIPYPSPIPPFSLPQVYPSSFSRRLCFAQYAQRIGELCLAQRSKTDI